MPVPKHEDHEEHRDKRDEHIVNLARLATKSIALLPEEHKRAHEKEARELLKKHDASKSVLHTWYAERGETMPEE